MKNKDVPPLIDPTQPDPNRFAKPMKSPLRPIVFLHQGTDEAGQPLAVGENDLAALDQAAMENSAIPIVIKTRVVKKKAPRVH